MNLSQIVEASRNAVPRYPLGLERADARQLATT